MKRLPVRTALVCALLVLAPQARADEARVLAAKARDGSGYAPAIAHLAAPEIEPNDTPAEATVLTKGEAISATLADAADEDWYRLDAMPGTYLTLSTSDPGAQHTDTVLEVFAADGVTRLAMDDDSGLALFSALAHFAVPGSGTLYLRVTRFSALGDEGYVLLAEDGVAPPPTPPNDLVVDAAFLEGCNTAVTGTTTGAHGEVGTLTCPSADPASVDPLGADVFYRVSVPWSSQLSVLVEPVGGWDLSAYLFLSATNPQERCVDAADFGYAGEPETLVFVNDHPSGLPMDVWIAVDSWSPQVAGDFILSTQCDFVVPNLDSSFGTLKGRFGR